ncbi:multiple coagulation factor deficiency protein 2 homolog isoform X2 [Amphibalanus amphitrite]|uniref:multiple coagulation factor deficiency protein 2 homolog isoform X2 n=1 Tax=Amphibalanus amphitrite TaxID=1232801 RepID=UPI001C90F535|nr:multiple coagulation factor deficiency protein 2 homolog isoform X2 [Amphibalanus amphitrite]
MHIYLVVSVLVVHMVQAEYRQPPGVNPNHYQQPGQVPQQQQQQFQQPPPQQQQFQQPPPQQQQQFQQPPPQQQQQFQQPPPQQPQQGVPQQQFQRTDGHGHGGHGQQQAILRDKQQITAEKDHIKEHLGAPIDTSKMSEEELQFHYFKMHDADGNNKLDGLELVASLQHWHDDGSGQETPDYPEWKIIEMVDLALLDADRNRDGLISWPEYKLAESRK